MSDIKDIINKIQKLNDSITINIPSKKIDVNIKQINIKQQKDLKTLPKNIMLAIVSLQKEINEIIKNNCNISIDQINIIDRIVIMIALKSQLSEEYNGVKMKDILQYVQSKPYTLTHQSIKTNNFKFEYEVPNLKRDQEVNKYILKEYNNQTVSIRNDNQMEILASQTYNDMMIPEICKFITDVKLISNEEEISTNWNTLSIYQQIQLLEEIPYNEITQIIKFIEDVRNVENEYLSGTINKNGKNIKYNLEFNFDFFNA